jgi:broad specificity phosphatase PhoE
MLRKATSPEFGVTHGMIGNMTDMLSRLAITGSILLVWILLIPVSVSAEDFSHRELVQLLRQGGYNIYFRHEATDWGQYDTVRQEKDWLSCDGSKMRQLSDAGRQRAKRSGEAMRQIGVPVSEVLASPYCRTMETARQFGLGEVVATTEVMNLRAAEFFGGREAIIAKARRLLASQPSPGSNRIVVAHGNVAQAATPVYPGEGEGVVFRPDGSGGFIVVDRIPPDRWLQLVRVE